VHYFSQKDVMIAGFDDRFEAAIESGQRSTHERDAALRQV
jgi:hypothetical protein